MKTHNLKINQLAPEVYEWYLSYLEAIDNKDIEAYGNFLANYCVMLSNNNSPVQGKAAILELISSYAKLNIHPFFLLALLNTEFRIQEYIINFAQALIINTVSTYIIFIYNSYTYRYVIHKLLSKI